jgi:large conductance mechanosensitive channel
MQSAFFEYLSIRIATNGRVSSLSSLPVHDAAARSSSPEKCYDFGRRRSSLPAESLQLRADEQATAQCAPARGDLPMLTRLLKEFRDFAMKGSVVDLAIGVIIGAAFGKIVDSLVNDIIMPTIGAITGGLDFSNYFLPLAKSVTATSLAEARKQGAVLAWGNFFTIAVNFIIIAFVLFLVIRGINMLRREVLREEEKAPATPPAPPRQEVLLEEIRDLIAQRPV